MKYVSIQLQQGSIYNAWYPLKSSPKKQENIT